MNIYVDTSVLISAFYTTDSNHKKAIEFFNRVTNDKVFISNHAIIEVYEHVRQKEVEFAKSQPSLRNETSIKNRTLNTFKTFMEKIVNSRSNVDVGGPDTPLDRHYYTVANVIKNLSGPIRERYQCPVCNSQFMRPFLEYEIPGRDDIHHAVMAHNLPCEKLVTFDKGFASFKNLKVFNGMEFVIL